MIIRATCLALTLGTAALITAPAHAGGPVIVEDVTETVQPDHKRQGWILPVLILGAAILIASGSGDDETPDKGCKTLEGC